jgi:glycosyltransferase involved in cell wall biosynthesis
MAKTELRPLYVLNGSTLIKGGALQACVNFIGEAVKDAQIDWHFAVSPEIAEQLHATGIEIQSERLKIISPSPARNKKSRKTLKEFVDHLNPYWVFTFFGPSYVCFKQKHLLGFADSWVLNPNKFAKKKLKTLSEKLKFSIPVPYKKYWLQKADFWVVETQAAKNGIKKITKCIDSKVAVVPNSCREVFHHIKAKPITSNLKSIDIIYITAYYPHKNLELIPLVANQLKRALEGVSFRFILTVSENNCPAVAELANQLDVEENVQFIGKTNLRDVCNLYEKSHIAFIPSLLEAFSATYSEAMACAMPIVTTDLDFSRSVCGNGAFYFPPNDAKRAAQAIITCLQDDKARGDVLREASIISKSLPNAHEKYNLYKKIMTDNMPDKGGYMATESIAAK